MISLEDWFVNGVIDIRYLVQKQDLETLWLAGND
jgi:hypothetical protein